MRDEQYRVVPKQMLAGRQIAFLMFQHFQINDMENAMLDFTDLLAVGLKGDNLRAFDTEWDNTLLGMKEVPYEKYLENSYRKQVNKSKQFEVLFTQLESDHLLRGRARSYVDLKSRVRHHLDRETRDKHLESKKKHQERGFPAAAGGNPGRKQGDCRAWARYGNCP